MHVKLCNVLPIPGLVLGSEDEDLLSSPLCAVRHFLGSLILKVLSLRGFCDFPSFSPWLFRGGHDPVPQAVMALRSPEFPL